MIKTVEEIQAIANDDFNELFTWYKELAQANNRRKIEEAIETTFGQIDPEYDFCKHEAEYGELYGTFRELFKDQLNFELY